MKSKSNNLAPLILFSEITTVDQLIRAKISKILPEGMAISHLSVLNHLASINNEKTPMQLAKSFHVTKGAITNTLSKLEASEAQREAMKSITPILQKVFIKLGSHKAGVVLPIIRELRNILSK